MAKTALKGQPVNTSGDFIEKGAVAPDFVLVKPDLSDISLKDFQGKKVILNIFPSIDTGVCAASVRRFNKEATGLTDTVVLAVSADLPFATARFCSVEGLENVYPASVFRNDSFGKDYGVLMVDGGLKGLLARSVVVVGADGKVLYSQLVPEITTEPDYEAALNAVK